MAKAKVGCCITSHGWGHAARTCAVMSELCRITPVEFVVLSQVPAAFFQESLSPEHFSYHSVQTDIGFVQKTSLYEDLELTSQALDDLYPLSNRRVEECVRYFADCSCIICDIAPLGIAAAQKLQIPSILIENFTWDWIYTAYLSQCPSLHKHIGYLKHLFCQADYHIQTLPVCQPGEPDLAVPPVARPLRGGAERIRHELLKNSCQSLVLITMGGGGRGEISLKIARDNPQVLFLLPGYTWEAYPDNVLPLPVQNSYYHPDLVAAVDVVVGKVGYSTTAEVVQAGTPFGYVERPLFPESSHLTSYIETHIPALRMSRQQLNQGDWGRELNQLLNMKRGVRSEASSKGASVIAAHLAQWCSLPRYPL